MNKYLSLLLLPIVGVMAVSCAKSNFEPLSIQEQAEYIPQHTWDFIRQKPISERAELIEYAAAANILGDYLKRDIGNLVYYLDISQKDAMALGVSKRVYKKHVAEMNRTNKSFLKDVALQGRPSKKEKKEMLRRGVKEVHKSAHISLPPDCRDSLIYERTWRIEEL